MFSAHLLSLYYLACFSAHINSWMALSRSWRCVCFHFKWTCWRQAGSNERSSRLRYRWWKLLVYAPMHLWPRARSLPILYALSWSLSEGWYEAASDWWLFLYSSRFKHNRAIIVHEWSSACRRQISQHGNCAICRCECTDCDVIQWLLWFSCYMLIITASDTTMRIWFKNLRRLSGKIVALICNTKKISIGFYWFAILMTRSPALLVVAKRLTSIVCWSSTAWKMLMLASCRWIQAPALTCFPSLTCLIKSLCLGLQLWWASFSTLLSTLCLSSATPWAVLLGTSPKRRRHISSIGQHWLHRSCWRHAPSWLQWAHCSASMLYSETHSWRINQHSILRFFLVCRHVVKFTSYTKGDVKSTSKLQLFLLCRPTGCQLHTAKHCNIVRFFFVDWQIVTFIFYMNKLNLNQHLNFTFLFFVGHQVVNFTLHHTAPHCTTLRFFFQGWHVVKFTSYTIKLNSNQHLSFTSLIFVGQQVVNFTLHHTATHRVSSL